MRFPDSPRIYDLTPEVSARTAVFPGDQPFERDVALSFSRGDSLELSAIRTSLHIGAHADAPNHYHPQGADIAARDLRHYFGRCQVVEVDLARGGRMMPAHLAGKSITEPRVLFRTRSFPDTERWNGDFNSLSPELVRWLAERGVVLVGIDTPSVDPADSKALESHQAIHEADLAILEGLVLEGVPEGVYQLIALPLKLKGADASPVRAILLECRDSGLN